MNEKTLSISELAKFGETATLNERAISLVNQQCSVWETAKTNYETLKQVQTKTFDFIHFKIIAQFNPGRIRSSAAKTDAASIAKRPCFLCTENLPPDQKGILFQEKYMILVNPFPIFTKHLTISHVAHTPQLIKNHFAELLDLSAALTDFTVFYNGPQCGASAPDHFHFQAVTKGFLPVETEFASLEKDFSEVIVQTGTMKVIATDNYLRRFVTFMSKDKMEIQKHFELIYKILDFSENEEPMMNILSRFENGAWQVILFPRQKQRSSHFFKTDESQIIVSPASVELGGFLILPREEDFNKITKKEIGEIYGEVTLNLKDFERLKNALRTLA